jgi:hydroxymethylbilane synthase
VNPLRIGTRRSKLAVAQAEQIRRSLMASGVDAELVQMSTSGDEGASASDTPAGLKGLWIDSILEALENGAIDVAVHSAKDLPAEDEEGLVIAAVPERADPSDVLVTHDGGLPDAPVIGTSSLRRRAQALRLFPRASVEPIRGNVDTRVRKVEEGVVDAALLAAAGLARLGLSPRHSIALPIERMVPAPGQGALAIQARLDDDATLDVLAPLDHPDSHLALDAERSLMWRVGGGCALPLGAHATVADERIRLLAMIATPDGSRLITAEEEGGTPEDVAAFVTQALLAEGAEEILTEARRA